MKKCKTVECEFCHEYISVRNYSRHYKKHLRLQSEPVYHTNHDDLVCKFCSKELKNKNSLVQHELRCKCNPNRKAFQPSEKTIASARESRKGKSPWNKGLTASSDSRVSGIAEKLKGRVVNKRKGVSDFTKKRLSDIARAGCYEKHFGNRKTYNYHNCIFISSYEVALAKDLDANSVKWLKPQKFTYLDDKRKQHTYTPDFYLPEYDVYLDPKNDFLINNRNPTLGYSDMEKIKWVQEQNNIRVIVLDKNSLIWTVVKRKIMEG